MELYNSKNLQDIINQLSKHVDNSKIILAVDCVKNSYLKHGSHIALSHIVLNTSFFNSCITREYQEILHSTVKNSLFIPVQKIEYIDERYFITIVSNIIKSTK